jgi:hypothetical protein
MGLPPRLYAHIKKQRATRRADRTAKAEAVRAFLLSALQRPDVRRLLWVSDQVYAERCAAAAQLASDRAALRESVDWFIDHGGPALFRRVASLAMIAGDGALHVKPQHEHPEITAVLRIALLAWPRQVVQESTTIDAVKYKRSPVGQGPKRMQPADSQWADKRADTMNVGELTDTWDEELRFIESVMETPKDERGSLLVSHIKLYAPPTVAQRLHWFEWTNNRLNQIDGTIGRLETRYRYQLDSLLDQRPSGWQRPAPAPDTRPVRRAVPAPLYGVWRADQLDVYDPLLGYVGTYRSWSHAVAIRKQRIMLRKSTRVAVIYNTRFKLVKGVQTLLVEPVRVLVGTPVPYWSKTTRKGLTAEE